MAQVRIRKALQIKNRLAGEVANLNKLIQNNNSHREGVTQFDVKKLLADRTATVAKLVAVKTALAVANTSIYGKLATLAEIKDEIKFLRGLNTNEGEEELGYGERAKTVKIVSEVTAADVEADVARLTLEIEKLQDEVDFFNSTTEITIPD
jgi:predicted secreted protein